MWKKQLGVKVGCMLWAVVMAASANATIVQFETDLGDFDVELFDDEMPITVANFLTYVDAGDYDNTVFHRLVPGFILQGGGFTFNNTDGFSSIVKRAAISHEHEFSNITGTISMALVRNDLDSAVSQWFFNLADNTDLDKNGASFAAFGRVIDDGMDVVNAIGDLPIKNYRQFVDTQQDELPVHVYSSGSVTEDHVVYIHAITRKITSSSSSSQSSSSSENSVSSSVSSLSSVGSSSSESSSSSSVSSAVSSQASVSSPAASPVSPPAVTGSSGGGGGSLGYISLLILLLMGVKGRRKT